MNGDPEQDALDAATDGPTGKSVGVYMTKEDGSVERLAQEQAGAELELMGIDDDPNCPACQGVDKVALLADIKAGNLTLFFTLVDEEIAPTHAKYVNNTYERGCNFYLNVEEMAALMEVADRLRKGRDR